MIITMILIKISIRKVMLNIKLVMMMMMMIIIIIIIIII